jgi:major vault protein
LKLSYNWYFEVDTTKPEKCKIFDIPDFVGDCCKAIASRVRAAVASVSFDHFHKNSADVIRDAIFGPQKVSLAARLVFSQNMLIVTTVDIQSVEPVDQRTQDSLLKSVQLAIDITTKSQEAAARHESARLEQQALGALERQKLQDQQGAEQSRKTLLELQAQTAAVETTGQATAEAKAKAEAAFIQGEADVKQAQLAAQAANVKSSTDLNVLKSNQEADLDFRAKMDALEIEKAKNLADIETNKAKATVTAIGVKTLKGIAESGPTMQAELLKGLGITSVLISDGNSPVNLFNTANGIGIHQ